MQKATCTLLNAIYEQDFLNCSYGFRPGRGQHDALDEIGRVICRRPISYMLEADIAKYFDSIVRRELIEMIEKRIRDGGILRLIRKRLRRGLKEVSKWCQAHRHDPVQEQCESLNAKLRGHYQYYGRPTNYQCLWQFYRSTRRIWKKWLNRRTRGKTVNWSVYEQILNRHPLLS